MTLTVTTRLTQVYHIGLSPILELLNTVKSIRALKLFNVETIQKNRLMQPTATKNLVHATHGLKGWNSKRKASDNVKAGLTYRA